MRLNRRSEVLVVGAGPVGMFTALQLAKAGKRVRIIDRAPHSSTESYGLALHPSTLALFGAAGIRLPIEMVGLELSRISFREGGEPRGTLHMLKANPEIPYLLVLPQMDLEKVLLAELAKLHVGVEWGHELTEIQEWDDGLVAKVAQLKASPQGYGVSDFALTVEKELDIETDFIIAADGRDSKVKRLLRIKDEEFGPQRSFVVFEFEAVHGLPREMILNFHGSMANVFWPLPYDRGRWTFEVESADDYYPQPTEEAVYTLMRERVPNFEKSVLRYRWSSQITFQSSLASRLAKGRVALAGDAAHSLLPFGVQSMNAGLEEAAILSNILSGKGHAGEMIELLQEYNLTRSDSLKRFLAPPTLKSSDWIAEHWHDIQAALPTTHSAQEEVFFHHMQTL